MKIGAEVTHGHVAVRGHLDRARAEPAGGVAINQQRQHHQWRILFAARAAMVDPKMAGGNLLGVQPEVDEGIGGQPLAQIAGQEQRRLAIKINEAGGNENQSRRSLLFKQFSFIFQRLSPTTS